MNKKTTITLWAVYVLSFCNQEVYDNIYRTIIQQALLSHDDATMVFDQRNTAIETLRNLCNGQLSSYERQLQGQSTSLRRPARHTASTATDGERFRTQ